MNDLSAAEQQAIAWSSASLNWASPAVSRLAGDASARRYFRLAQDAQSRVLMVSPPERGEKNPQFIAIAELLRSLGVRAPEVLHRQDEQGWMLLTDFGDRLYLSALQHRGSKMKPLYRRALDVMIRQHGCPADRLRQLETFAVDRMVAEASMVRSWYLEKLLRLHCEPALWRRCQAEMAALAADIAGQPVVLTHFDFHSRNLLIAGDGPPAVLDFQDALAGPLALDPVSLLRDCYLELDEPDVLELLDYYRRQAIQAGILKPEVSPETLFDWFNQCGLQRHLRVLGTFARLSVRDGKDRYLSDIPLTLRYALRACAYLDNTPALAELLHLSEPAMAAVLREKLC